MSKMDLNLVIYPEPFLRYRAAPFKEEQFGTEILRNTAGAMIRAMYKLNGVGLAAEQVGVPQSIFVMDHQWHDTGKRKPKIFINAEIITAEEPAIEIDYPGEGCLSLPYGFRNPVPRASRIEVEWYDIKGGFHVDWFEGMEAIVIQHETDHLYGMIFPDRLSRLKQDMFKRKVRKMRRLIEKNYKRRIADLKNAPKQSPQYNLERMRKLEMEKKHGKASKGHEHEGEQGVVESCAGGSQDGPALEVSPRTPEISQQ